MRFLVLISVFFGFIFSVELKVGATPVPHAKMLEHIKPLLKKEGIYLKIVEFTDYVTPNLALNDGSLDANFMQHKPYLDKINKDRKLNLTSIANIHIEPIGAYSNKIKNINELKNGALILIPADPTNGARALIMLHNNNLITLKDVNNLAANEFDIVKNPKKLRIKPIEAALLPKTLNEGDLAIINGNYALQAGLNSKKALILEDSRSPYANVLVVRKNDEKNENLIKLKNALQSKEIKDFLDSTYKGEVIPAF